MVYVHTTMNLWGGKRSCYRSLPIDERLRWARLIGRELPALTEEQQSSLWGNWLNDYWSQRRHGHLGSHSMPLTPREAAIMAGWLPSLPAVFPQAFALVGAETNSISLLAEERRSTGANYDSRPFLPDIQQVLSLSSNFYSLTRLQRPFIPTRSRTLWRPSRELQPCYLDSPALLNPFKVTAGLELKPSELGLRRNFPTRPR